MNKIKIDLHVHTNASHDGLSTPAMAVRAAVKRGLHGIAVTDHNTNIAVEAVRKAAPKGFIIIPGVEYSTDCGHVLALFCDEMWKGFNAEKGRCRITELGPFVRERGGILIYAHPFQYGPGIPEMVFDWVHGLESVNARALIRNKKDRERVEKTAEERGLFTTGGSDGHMPQEIGGGYTEFPAGVDLREALLRGLCRPQGDAGRRLYWAVSRVWSRLRRPLSHFPPMEEG
jgi:hypothetical protein